MFVCLGCTAHARFAVPPFTRGDIGRGGGLRGRCGVNVCEHGVMKGGAFCCAGLPPPLCMRPHHSARAMSPPRPYLSRVNGDVANCAFATHIRTFITISLAQHGKFHLLINKFMNMMRRKAQGSRRLWPPCFDRTQDFFGKQKVWGMPAASLDKLYLLTKHHKGGAERHNCISFDNPMKLFKKLQPGSLRQLHAILTKQISKKWGL